MRPSAPGHHGTLQTAPNSFRMHTYTIGVRNPCRLHTYELGLPQVLWNAHLRTVGGGGVGSYCLLGEKDSSLSTLNVRPSTPGPDPFPLSFSSASHQDADPERSRRATRRSPLPRCPIDDTPVTQAIHTPAVMLVSALALQGGPSAAQNRTVKTPCLKCGLIHDEPTAICDGYAGLDPDETAGDTRKKAAERIRAILAAVPIESRPAGRGRRRTESSSTVAEMKPPSERAGAAAGERAADAAEPEVPEWRREVSERLETYRQRRERQSRTNGNGQSVLEFRVHSKKDAGAADAVPEVADPPAEAGNPMQEFRTEPRTPDTEAIISESGASVPQAMAAAAGAGPAASRARTGTISSAGGERIYAPPDVHVPDLDTSHDSPSIEAPANEFEDVELPPMEQEAGALAPVSACDAEVEIAAAEAALPGAELPAEPPESLPLATDPAIVLADATTLEVHADPLELEAAAPAAAFAAPYTPAVEALPAIPAIDTEYWRTAPSVEPDAAFDLGEVECGSLTSGLDAHRAVAEEFPAGPAAASLTEVNASPLLEETIESPLQPAAETAPEPAPDYAAMAGIEAPGEALFSGEPAEDEVEVTDPRREALRTASRRSPATPPERIEINVPQPVFDFAAPGTMSEHPQDQQVPVADLRERRSAGAIDAAILAFTVAAFFIAFRLAGGELSFSRVGVAVVLAASFLIYAQYFLLFTVTAGATPGMMLRGLRVVCFDGTSPGALELCWRGFGCLLSAAAGMLGFVWAAWDEDGLTWHDRISQTYITYAEMEALPVHAPVQ